MSVFEQYQISVYVKIYIDEGGGGRPSPLVTQLIVADIYTIVCGIK